MEFKGTKGKWEVKINEYGYLTSVYTDNSQNPNSFRTICARVDFQDENNANLLLISKAPELLEMLKRLIQPDLDISDLIEAENLIKEATKL